MEDIVDRAHLGFHSKYFEQKSCRSKICALIDKQERRESEVIADYTGPGYGFLVGGLDLIKVSPSIPFINWFE
jgi:hypoxanthine-guanine phosphoribosyltransferase